MSLDSAGIFGDFKKIREDLIKEELQGAYPVAAMSLQNGILLVAKNPVMQNGVRKLSEIYHRIAYGAAGNFMEFNSLREELIVKAHLKGYQLSEEDVDATELANFTAKILYTVFWDRKAKPFGVALILAEAGDELRGDKLFKLNYDGQHIHYPSFVVVGSPESENKVREYLTSRYNSELSFADALRLIKEAFSYAESANSKTAKSGPAVTVKKTNGVPVEIAVLVRSKPGRKFERREENEL